MDCVIDDNNQTLFHNDRPLLVNEGITGEVQDPSDRGYIVAMTVHRVIRSKDQSVCVTVLDPSGQPGSLLLIRLQQIADRMFVCWCQLSREGHCTCWFVRLRPAVVADGPHCAMALLTLPERPTQANKHALTRSNGISAIQRR